MNPPAFQWYPKDFETDEVAACMTLAERGAYITLLGYCWLEGSIPDDLVRLARLCRCSMREMQHVWPALEPKFPLGLDGRRRNPRLERERAAQIAFREERSTSGRLGNLRRRTGGSATAQLPLSGGSAMAQRPLSDGSATAEPPAQPLAQRSANARSAVCNLQSAICSLQAEQQAASNITSSENGDPLARCLQELGVTVLGGDEKAIQRWLDEKDLPVEVLMEFLRRSKGRPVRTTRLVLQLLVQDLPTWLAENYEWLSVMIAEWRRSRISTASQ